MQERKAAEFPVLISHRIMQSVRADIAPESIQSHLE